MGSDQMLHGPEGLDEIGAVGGLDVTTAEIPLVDRPRASVLAEGGDLGVGSPGAVSISLETSEVPFQQPNSRLVPVQSGARDWRAAVADAGKWPLVALGAAAVLVALFAMFITRSGQSPSGDAEAVDAPPAVESASAAVSADQVVGAPAQADLDASGRSTGTLGPGEDAAFFSGQVVEPDRSLADGDLDWTPSTVPPTTPPTIATTATTATTEASSTTEASTTTEAETTLPPTSDTTAPPTSETTAPEPSGPWVRAIGPGSGDAQNPTAVSGRVTLEAEGSNEFMRYRFFVHVRTDGGEWRQVERSRWRFDRRWTFNTNSYEGRTLRWTVVGLTGFRNQTDGSAPLYLQVGGGD